MYVDTTVWTLKGIIFLYALSEVNKKLVVSEHKPIVITQRQKSLLPPPDS